MMPVKITGALRKGQQMTKPCHCRKCGKMILVAKGNASQPLEICASCMRK